MKFNQNELSGIVSASGLLAEESAMLTKLLNEYNLHLNANNEKLDYYNDRVTCNNLNKRLPDEIKRLKVAPGWIAKAVHMLARRSIFDGISLDGETAEQLEAIMRDNKMADSYAMALPSELIFGCGIWTVSPRFEPDEPEVVINYHDMTESSCLWNYRKNRIACAMVVEDYEKDALGKLRPSCVVLHTDIAVVEIVRTPNGWVATRKEHSMGRCLAEAMRFQPSKSQPLGKSRVSASARSITRQVILETQNLIAHSQAFSLPQKVLVGLSDEQYDALIENKSQVYATDLFMATRDADGNVPQYDIKQASGVSEHTQIIENLAQRMASETDLPLSAFGVLGNNYTSSDALRASSDDLIILCEAMNRTNGEALLNVAKMALCMAQDKPLSELTEDEKAMIIHWRDPAMPSIASISDAMVKQASVVPEFASTSVFWEALGYSDEQRRRIQAELKENQQTFIASRVLGG